MFSCPLRAVWTGCQSRCPAPSQGVGVRLNLSQSRLCLPENLTQHRSNMAASIFPTIAYRQRLFIPDSQTPKVVLGPILSKTPFSSFPSDSGSYPYSVNNSLFLLKSEVLFAPSGCSRPNHGHFGGWRPLLEMPVCCTVGSKLLAGPLSVFN